MLNSSHIFYVNLVPNPDPVPPPKLQITFIACGQSEQSSYFLILSRAYSLICLFSVKYVSKRDFYCFDLGCLSVDEISWFFCGLF